MIRQLANADAQTLLHAHQQSKSEIHQPVNAIVLPHSLVLPEQLWIQTPVNADAQSLNVQIHRSVWIQTLVCADVPIKQLVLQRYKLKIHLLVNAVVLQFLVVLVKFKILYLAHANALTQYARILSNKSTHWTAGANALTKVCVQEERSEIKILVSVFVHPTFVQLGLTWIQMIADANAVRLIVEQVQDKSLINLTASADALTPLNVLQVKSEIHSHADALVKQPHVQVDSFSIKIHADVGAAKRIARLDQAKSLINLPANADALTIPNVLQARPEINSHADALAKLFPAQVEDSLTNKVVLANVLKPIVGLGPAKSLINLTASAGALTIPNVLQVKSEINSHADALVKQPHVQVDSFSIKIHADVGAAKLIVGLDQVKSLINLPANADALTIPNVLQVKSEINSHADALVKQPHALMVKLSIKPLVDVVALLLVLVLVLS